MDFLFSHEVRDRPCRSVYQNSQEPELIESIPSLSQELKVCHLQIPLPDSDRVEKVSIQASQERDTFRMDLFQGNDTDRIPFDSDHT